MQKHLQHFALVLLLVVLFLQCDKPPIIRPGKVYVAGTELFNAWTDSGYSVAKLWIDGRGYDLPSNCNFTEARTVFVSRNIVYVAGFGYDTATNRSKAILWRNMQPIYLSGIDEDAAAYSVFADGAVVYVTGFVVKNGIQESVIWKNGLDATPTLPLNGYLNYNDLYIDAGQQYSPGYNIVNGLYKPVIIKGNQLLPLELPATANSGGPNSVFVKGNNVYAAGQVRMEENNKQTIYSAVRWINGQAKILATGLMTNMITASDIAVSATDDVFVLVQNLQTDQGYSIWKNDQLLYRSKINESWSSIALSGKDVYAAGQTERSPVNNQPVILPMVWKNNIAQPLPINAKVGLVSSIFVR